MDGELGQPADNDESNVVVQLFSKTPIEQELWERLQDHLPAVIGDSDFSSTCFVEDRSHNADRPTSSSFMTFHACLVPDTAHGDLTLVRCRAFRLSPSLRAFENKESMELVVQPLELWKQHRTPGLAVFDMDSTLIQQEVIDELARSVGRYEQVAAVTEAAMRGELDFEASLRARVGKLKGVPNDIWDKLKTDVITFTPGARELVRFLKSKGWKTAVLSGGFTPLAYWVKDTLGLDYAYANELATDGATKTLSGELNPGAPIVGAALKRELLLKLAAENGIPVERTIAVGDGSNDLLMMGAAGLGIAFNAKPKVQEAAPARLNSGSLVNVAYVLGYSKEEVEKALTAHGP